MDTFRENVVLLARHCLYLRPERLSGTRKVEVSRDGRAILADIVIIDDPALVGPHEIGVSQPALRRLGAAAGDRVDVTRLSPRAACRASGPRSAARR